MKSEKNIELFGGDRNSVTIFGNDAGGIAVDMLLLSHNAKGLFHKAVCQSGVTLLGLLLSWKPKERAYKLAETFKFNPRNSEEVVRSLKEMNPWELAENSSTLVEVDETLERQIGIMTFTPTVNTNSKRAFLNKMPETIFLDGSHPNKDIPIMIGFSSQESIYFSKYYIARPHFLHQMEKQFSYLWPMRDLYSKFKSHPYFEVAYRIKYFYFPNGTIDIRSNSSLNEYLSMMSDLFIYPIDRAVRSYANSHTAPVYYYRFSFDGHFNHFKISATTPLFDGIYTNVTGASGKDEICYLFRCTKYNLPYKDAHKGNEKYETSLKMIRKMVRLWTNFAKNG